MLLTLLSFCRALSYAWGPSSEDGSHLTDTIVCNGCRLSVTSNLKQALRRIRAKSLAELSPRPIAGSKHQLDGIALWVDAICINQHDLQERSSQVQIMARIFADCRILVIWLGEPDEGELGVSQCELFRKQAKDERRSRLRWPRTNRVGAHQDTRTVLQSILRRSWFKRRWLYKKSLQHKS